MSLQVGVFGLRVYSYCLLTPMRKGLPMRSLLRGHACGSVCRCAAHWYCGQPQIEVIASWNFRHIASVWARSRIEAALQELGYGACHIATPDELTEGEFQ
jgi:hypothetical protein